MNKGGFLHIPGHCRVVRSFVIETSDIVPYTRMTQGEAKLLRIPEHKVRADRLSTWNKVRRYQVWKEFVAAHTYGMKFNRSPKGLEEKTYLNVMCYFPNLKHADPENVRKGIQDALFENDKYVAGAVDFDYDPVRPRVEVTICQPE